MAASGHFSLFICLFAGVALHEAVHMLTAKCFGLATGGVLISPMGQAAHINGLYNITPLKRVVILLAGPVASAALAGITTVFLPGFQDFIYANAFIALWNVIPAAPLDGGAILYILLNNIFGTAPANKIIKRISFFIYAILLCAGFVYAALFSYDISLVAAALYLKTTTAHEIDALALEHSRAVFAGSVKYMRVLNVKNVYIPAQTPVLKALDRISFDRLTVFHFYDDKNGRQYAADERRLARYARDISPFGTVSDFIDYETSETNLTLENDGRV